MAELFWPFDPSIINYGFGYPPGYGGFHNGIDFPVPQGTELRATVSGVIRNNDAGSRDGAGVDISTPDGWTVRMWHVSAFLIPNGSQVNAGDVVALSGGQPGTWGAGNATGPHLHWGTAVGRNGNDYNWVDPVSLNPKSFDNPQPLEEEDMAIGAFYRVADGANRGGIYWQEKPNTPFIPINEVETWDAYAANGNKYNNITGAMMDTLKAKYGTQSVPSAGSSGTVVVPDFNITMSGQAVKK